MKNTDSFIAKTSSQAQDSFPATPSGMIMYLGWLAALIFLFLLIAKWIPRILFNGNGRKNNNNNNNYRRDIDRNTCNIRAIFTALDEIKKSVNNNGNQITQVQTKLETIITHKLCK